MNAGIEFQADRKVNAEWINEWMNARTKPKHDDRREKKSRLSRFVKWAENLKSLASLKCRLKLASSILYLACITHWLVDYASVRMCVCVSRAIGKANKKKCPPSKNIRTSHETILFHFVEHFRRKNKHKGSVSYFSLYNSQVPTKLSRPHETTK